MLRICPGFSQGHLEILLARYVSQCLLLRMEHCFGGKQGARREGKTNIICISLAPFGDVNTGQIEKITKQSKQKNIPDFLQLPVAFFVFLAGLGLGNMWHKQISVFYVVICYKNLDAECDSSFTALLEDGKNHRPIAVSLA